ncbi:outer membrane beta-barrel protein [Spartinivicinus ruber]|uniref:outer membrane beta-barrel protein n=1 Tax=Spartinivicinus ruber TaxID=2683272 RepID=UPI0013CF8642|nr:outer membrane beta-barrel protein [Spartinivicinus ruber]
MKKAVLAVAVVSAFAVPAFAETNLNPFEDSKSGFYLGLGLGAADYDDSFSTAKDRASNVGGTLKYTERDGIWKVFTGYRVNKYFGVEASYNSLGNPEADFYPNGSNAVVETEAEIKGYGVKAIGYYPINNSFELQASVGALKWKAEEETKVAVGASSNKIDSKSEKGTSLTVGLGANYNLTKNIAFGLQWERINDVGDKELLFGETDIDTYTLSAQYKF